MRSTVTPNLWNAVALVLLLTCTAVQGENETVVYVPRGKPADDEESEPNVRIVIEPKGNVMCYECSSWTHPLCDDPFNFTLSAEKGPPFASCDGCCVKLVQNIGTHYVDRTMKGRQ
ncbi:uncharacterized protein LOC121863034 isoform X2 [Homarus americanus]|uniref:uncharacterized protein LOC121863034 isoform X2 n=1 Tax=Homarus americanus TaxID=6706 RepID=UPI001C484938|nr:uncharacterized protein LOC121863034 isoform X2 [Homarus americanus]